MKSRKGVEKPPRRQRKKGQLQPTSSMGWRVEPEHSEAGTTSGSTPESKEQSEIISTTTVNSAFTLGRSELSPFYR